MWSRDRTERAFAVILSSFPRQRDLRPRLWVTSALCMWPEIDGDSPSPDTMQYNRDAIRNFPAGRVKSERIGGYAARTTRNPLSRT